MKALADKIYNSLLDMDFMDYAETEETDLKNLEEDLELLQKQGNGTLLEAIKMLLETTKN